MNKICFIMPIYPPHFGYANAFVRSFFRFGFDSQADLAFVFSDKNEAQMFKHTNFNGYYKSLILPKYLRVSRDNGIINIKKFYALKKLHKIYEFLIIIDSESEIIKNVHLKRLCDEFYAKKRLFGNATICDASKIKNESKKFSRLLSPQRRFQMMIYIFGLINLAFTKAHLSRNFSALRILIA